MAEQRSPVPARPRPRPVKVIGILNVLFGSVLLAYAWLMLGGMAFNGMSASPNAALEEALEGRAEREHQATLDRLGALEAGAEFESAREIYRDERARLEDRGPKPAFGADMMTMGGRMQQFGAWSAINSASSVVLNLLLIASGVLLLQRVEWGRRLGIWVAGLKLARLVVMQVTWIAFVVPSMSRSIGAMVGETMAAQGGGPQAGAINMTQIYAVFYSIWGVAVLIFGSIYPIIVLIYLTRPGVRAACKPAEIRAREMMAEVARS